MNPRMRYLVASAAASAFWLAGCAVLESGDSDATGADAGDTTSDTAVSGLTCLGCHGDEEMLKAALPPEEPATETESTADG
ncbi:MAG: hypothetical protein CVU56_26340 [Deltaproteobacteria bacterium HGW-Deltaproteobacteria-14]|jgi:hypothetical protein|nr:MAG: hypothetical protein CVU56_26340 [Deltaproteobacteria bacterium HGW-Deltaproteobacteria-14]